MSLWEKGIYDDIDGSNISIEYNTSSAKCRNWIDWYNNWVFHISLHHVAVQNTVQSKNITKQEIIKLIIIEHNLPGNREAVPLVQLNEMQDLYFSESSQAMILNPPNLDNY